MILYWESSGSPQLRHYNKNHQILVTLVGFSVLFLRYQASGNLSFVIGNIVTGHCFCLSKCISLIITLVGFSVLFLRYQAFVIRNIVTGYCFFLLTCIDPIYQSLVESGSRRHFTSQSFLTKRPRVHSELTRSPEDFTTGTAPVKLLVVVIEHSASLQMASLQPRNIQVRGHGTDQTDSLVVLFFNKFGFLINSVSFSSVKSMLSFFFF